MTADAFTRVVDQLAANGSKVRTMGEGRASAQCPAHHDGTPSLSVTRIEGSVLIYCHGGCDTENVLDKLGLAKRDLFDDTRGARYDYADRSGTIIRTVSRTPDKVFRQSGDTKGHPTLYRLPQVVQAVAEGKVIYLVEGEKDVHALESIGLVATTAPMGATNFAKVDASPLRGAKVVAVVDDDKAGRKWAALVHDKLDGVCRSLVFVQAAVGKDAADHIAAGHSLDDFLPLGLDAEQANIAVEQELAFNREVADELHKLRYRTEARRQFDAEQAGERPQVQTVDGASFLLNQPDKVPCIWGTGSDVLWAEGEPLMVCGLPGVGKTTIAGQVLRARLGIGDGMVLGLPVTPDTRPILYLAMDRPRQISRALGRLFTAADHDILRERLIVRPGPPPEDLAVNTDLLAQLAHEHGAGTVFLDSLKDAFLGLSEDEPAAAYNRARQTAITASIELLEMHHMVKRGASGGKPKTLADVYGSTWLTAGAGSVIVLNGDPGDPLVELRHLKQPAAEVGPWRVLHDSITGLSVVFHATDLVALAMAQGDVSARDAAKALAETDKPTPNDVEKARRKLAALVRSGHLIVTREGNDALHQSTLWATPHLLNQTLTAPLTAPPKRETLTTASRPSRQNTKPQVKDPHGTPHGPHGGGPSRTPPLLEGGGVSPKASPAVENKESDPSTCPCGNPISDQRHWAGKDQCVDCEAAS
jgi:AAA domain